MRLRGRRHRTETVSSVTVTPGTGRHTGAKTAAVTHENVRASVQPVGAPEVLEHGLTTDRPVFWIRFRPGPPVIGDTVKWRGESYRVVSISEGESIDTQLLVQRTGGAE